jgi:hypothetical protein
MARVDKPKKLLQNNHNHVCTILYGVLTQTTLWILTLWAPQIPYQKLFRTVTLIEMTHWDNWIIEEQYIILHSIYLISHTFPNNCVSCYKLRLKKLRKQTIFNTNTYFMIRTTYVEFQTSTTIIPQGNLTSDLEIKQDMWQWKDKEDCSRSEVPCITLIIWMTVPKT